MKKVMILLLSLFVVGESVFAAATVDARCAAWGDSLGEAEALARTAWTLKCYPWLKHTMDNGKVQLLDTQTGAISSGYPMFGQVAADGTATPVVAPTNSEEACWDTNAYVFIGFCRAGCFTPDQKILFNEPNSYVEIGKAKDLGLSDILLVDGVNSQGHLSIKNRNLVSYTVDPEDRDQNILVIRTVDGEVKVTQNHPLVDGRGYMVAASTLQVGDSLKTIYNSNSQIVDIEKVITLVKFTISTWEVPTFMRILLSLMTFFRAPSIFKTMEFRI